MADLTDAGLDRLAALLGLDTDEVWATAEQIERVRRAGHRIGEGHRPFPGGCGHIHRLDAL